MFWMPCTCSAWSNVELNHTSAAKSFGIYFNSIVIHNQNDHWHMLLNSHSLKKKNYNISHYCLPKSYIAAGSPLCQCYCDVLSEELLIKPLTQSMEYVIKYLLFMNKVNIMPTVVYSKRSWLLGIIHVNIILTQNTIVAFWDRVII